MIDNYVKIPHLQILCDFSDAQRRTLMNNAMEEYRKKTCVRFVPRNCHRDYVRMVNQNIINIIQFKLFQISI